MATYSKIVFSGSTDGRAIKIAATSTPGTTIHTASAISTTYDEIWIQASNSDTAPHKITIEWGGTTSPDDTIEVTIPAESGLVPVINGNVIKGNATPLVVKAFCDTTNLVTIHGFVNRIA